MRRLKIFIIAMVVFLGASFLAGPLLLRQAVGPLVRKALRRTPLRIVILANPKAQLYPPLLALKRVVLADRGSGEVLGHASEVRLGVRLNPSALNPTLALNVKRVVLQRSLSALAWEEGDARRFVRHLLVNLRWVPMEWSIGELTWSGEPLRQATLRGVSGTLNVEGTDSLSVTAQSNLEPQGSPLFREAGVLSLRGRLRRYYDATTFRGAVEWTPELKAKPKPGSSRLDCRLTGLLESTLVKAALTLPSSCSVHPANPDNRHFWAMLAGRSLPGVSQ